jgi:hypothetical protein
MRSFWQLVVAITAVAAAGAGVGRWVEAHEDAGRAAAAGAQAAAAEVRRAGLPLDEARRGGVEALVRAQGLDARLAFTVTEAPGVALVGCEATTRLELAGVAFPVSVRETSLVELAPPPLVPVPLPTVVAPPPRAAPVTVAELDTVRTGRAKVVLVLDYSGSMLNPLVGSAGGPSSFAALRQAVAAFLDGKPDAILGLVIFATQVLDEVPIGAGYATIRAHVDRPLACPDAAGRCMTQTWQALERAGELFAFSPGPEHGYLVLVSDGAPFTYGVPMSEGIARSRAAAARLAQLGVTIVTFQLVNSVGPETEQLRKFMVSISGPPGHAGSQSLAFTASSAEALQRQLAHVAVAGAYQAGPVPPPPPGRRLIVALRTRGGAEIPLRAGANLTDERSTSEPFYRYDAGRRVLVVTPFVEARVNQQHDTLVVRAE